jgi:hypothetical protein
MAVLSKNATVKLPSLFAGSPFSEIDVYISITIGAGMKAAIAGFKNSAGGS